MRDIFDLEPKTRIIADDSYVVSYPYLLEYFSSKPSLDAGDIVRGAHMIYGWMPTALKLHLNQGKNGLDGAVHILTKAKAGGVLSDEEIKALAGVVNNSLVGATKLLHFVAPNHFPIWDSRVYSFLHEEIPHYYRLNSINAYRQYVSLLNELVVRRDFPAFHASVKRKLGYSVSPLRALELVMFLNAPVRKN